MTYQRDTYAYLHRHEVIAPAVRNDGEPSGYPDALAWALAEAGFNWTAIETVGCWHGKIEAGRQFTIFAPIGVWKGDTTADRLGRIARAIMTDQDAIQIVVDPNPVTLIEA